MNKLTLKIFTVLLCAFLLMKPAYSDRGNSGQLVFDSPEKALAELVAAAKNEDSKRMTEIFGKPSETIFITGDDVADKAALRKLSSRFDQRAELFPVISEEFAKEEWFLVRFGIEAWNIHIPLVSRGDGWSFASEYATRADLRRRKAINEVAAVDTLRALVLAQEKYKSEDRNGDGVMEYAQRFFSSKGKMDGLYWPATNDLPASPLDAIVSRAIQDGYEFSGKGTPYGGYIYRILTSQGAKTRGGKKSYLQDGHLTTGFAILAYPVEWNSSGDSTFLVGKDGQVWKSDLGSRTYSEASSMKSMDLDSRWVRVDPNLGGKNSRSNW